MRKLFYSSLALCAICSATELSNETASSIENVEFAANKSQCGKSNSQCGKNNTNYRRNNKAEQQKLELQEPMMLYASYDNRGMSNLGVRGDLLYMVYNAPVLSYAADQSTVGGILNSKILDVRGRMSWGCDLALLYTLPHNPGYSFKAGWYHVIAKFRDHVTSKDLVPSHSVALAGAGTPGEGSVHAHLNINFFDLMMSKDFSFGKPFWFSPGVGLVGGYMTSKNLASFRATSGDFGAGISDTTVASLNQHIKFEGIGVKVGLDAKFTIACGLKLIGNFYYNTLYGFSKAHLLYASNGSYSAAHLTGANSHYSHHHGRTFFDSMLGLAWQKTSECKNFFVDLHAGWRFQAFPNGWMAFEAEFNDSVQDLPLMGQGLEAGITLKF